MNGEIKTIGRAAGWRGVWYGFKGTMEDLKNWVENEFKTNEIMYKQEYNRNNFERKIIDITCVTEGCKFSWIKSYTPDKEFINGNFPDNKEINLDILLGFV
jgi:hypothetical protein